MKDRVYIPIPQGFDDEISNSSLITYFKRFIGNELAKALDTDVWEFDERAQVYETNITDVEISGNTIHITYNILFEAYYGCRDQNHADEDERFLTGTRIENYWVFDAYIPRERRSTNDEF